jgi:hypothetical protein
MNFVEINLSEIDTLNTLSNRLEESSKIEDFVWYCMDNYLWFRPSSSKIEDFV